MEYLFHRAPQGFKLGSTSFNILIADLILLIGYIVDNKIIYCSNDCVDDAIASLTEFAKTLFRRFLDNQMMGKTD